MARKHCATSHGARGVEGLQGLSPARTAKAARGLTQIAEGDTPEIAKPMTGLGAGVWELAIKERGDAFRVIYALQLIEERHRHAEA
ncbi:type II toxin-antitoxin system RelE/ParE family toxin [Hankyongella ginsenosidimutans]|uniref:type II toxin-antitoxin system RelE/ParE family toxin n=1 Tax=Hankyongella ginsenosidimutans TaxID=1763828 RepID=UPI001CA314B2|nr:type II toxin-antitoxin system RelE/ParE family toxin [Hankyongella ginsenosidimutans]